MPGVLLAQGYSDLAYVGKWSERRRKASQPCRKRRFIDKRGILQIFAECSAFLAPRREYSGSQSGTRRIRSLSSLSGCRMEAIATQSFTQQFADVMASTPVATQSGPSRTLQPRRPSTEPCPAATQPA